MRLLIIEDNVALTWKLRGYLDKHFETHAARTGSEGLRLAEAGRFDIIILDLGLPDMNGEEICISLRRHEIITPILVLTAEDILQTKVRLLDVGADDYLVKPFELAELHARLRALLRRHQVETSPTVLQAGSLMVDPRRRMAMRDGQPIHLRRKEFDILEYLVRNRGKIITQAMILNHVWGEPEKGLWSSTVRVHVKHLRDKVDRPFNVPLIKTARGVGYILEAR